MSHLIKKKKKAIILDEVPEFRKEMRQKLFENEIDPIADFDTSEALIAFLCEKKKQVDYIIFSLDIKEDALEIIRRLTAEFPEIVILATAQSDKIKTAVQAMRAGAKSYLPKPVYTSTLVQTISDITYDQLQLERKTRITSLLSLLATNTSVGTILLDSSNRVIWSNNIFFQITGIDPTTKNIKISFQTEGLIKTFAFTNGELAIPPDGTMQSQQKDNQFVEVSSLPIEYKEENYTVVQLRDISSYKHTENIILKKLRNLTDITQSMPIGTIQVKKDGHILKMNDVARKLVAKTQDNNPLCTDIHPTDFCHNCQLFSGSETQATHWYISADSEASLLYYCVKNLKQEESELFLTVFLVDVKDYYKAIKATLDDQKEQITTLSSDIQRLQAELHAIKTVKTDVTELKSYVDQIFSSSGTPDLNQISSANSGVKGELRKLFENIIGRAKELGQFNSTEAQLAHIINIYQEKLVLFDKLAEFDITFRILSLLSEIKALDLESLAAIVGINPQILKTNLQIYIRAGLLDVSDNGIVTINRKKVNE